MSTVPERLRGGRSAREAIVAAATDLFLEHGYQATTTDQIAAAASTSKQTVYNQFGDKATLFAAVLERIGELAQGFTEGLPATFAGIESPDDVLPGLRGLARDHLRTVVVPPVLALRRLVIGEAGRFPELAATYYRTAPARTLEALAAGFADLGERGLLTVDDAARVAEDFAFLVLGAPLDRGLFHPGGTPPTDRDLDAHADRAVRVLLSALRP